MAEEKQFENKIKKLLKTKGIYYFKFWGTMYTKAGVPDIIACVNGRFLGIEVKAEKGKPSEIQLENIRQIRRGGGYAVVCYPDQYDKLERLIDALLNGYDSKAKLCEGGFNESERHSG